MNEPNKELEQRVERLEVEVQRLRAEYARAAEAFKAIVAYQEKQVATMRGLLEAVKKYVPGANVEFPDPPISLN